VPTLEKPRQKPGHAPETQYPRGFRIFIPFLAPTPAQPRKDPDTPRQDVTNYVSTRVRPGGGVGTQVKGLDKSMRWRCVFELTIIDDVLKL
jgi:hypothetical protein